MGNDLAREDSDEKFEGDYHSIRQRFRSIRRYRIITLRFPQSEHKFEGIVSKKKWNRLRGKNYLYIYEGEEVEMKGLIVSERPFYPRDRKEDRELKALNLKPYIPRLTKEEKVEQKAEILSHLIRIGEMMPKVMESVAKTKSAAGAVEGSLARSIEHIEEFNRLLGGD